MIHKSCPKCGKITKDGFKIRGQFCICGWMRPIQLVEAKMETGVILYKGDFKISKKAADRIDEAAEKAKEKRRTMLEEKRLKLFVWENVLCDWTCGLVCVMAYDKKHALRLLKDKSTSVASECEEKEPEVIDNKPYVAYIYGGG